MNLKQASDAGLWVVVGLIASGIVYAFNTFATQKAHADDVDELKYQIVAQVDPLKLSVWYGQYYDRLDDFDEAMDEGNEPLAEEYARQMEKLRAQICKYDPDWERCD